MKRKNPEGYKKLLVYQRAEELRQFVFEITEKFPISEFRRKEHMRDSARSVKQNVVEGWKRETTQQYIDFLSFSFGSLGELKEDGKDCLNDGLISQREFEELERRCGELDYLMRRLKESLERKIQKSQVFSPYQRWLKTKMEERDRKEREFDEELKRIVEGARKGKKGEMGEMGERGEKRELGKREEREGNEEKGNFPKKFLSGFMIVFVCFSVFVPMGIKAQKEIKLFVSPEMFELKVERGQISEDKMIIFNKSQIPVPIEVMVTNFGAQEESGTITFFDEPAKRVGEEDDVSYNPRKWIKIENPNFILDPYEREEIRFKIEIPENAEPGGHFAVVLFEPKLPSFYFEEKTVRAIPKIGVLFLFSVKVEGLERAEIPLTIIEFAIPEKFHLQKLEDFFVKTVRAAEGLIIVERSHLPFVLSIKNNDIYHIKPEGKLSILNNNGKIVGETEIKETTILPGRIRRFPVEFKPDLPERLTKFLPASISKFISQNLLFGKYRALLNLKVGDDIISKEIEFWVFPWKVALILLTSALFFLLIVMIYRKRIKSALLVLFKRRV